MRRYIPKWTGLILFANFLALAFRLRQRDLEFSIEPDFRWTLIKSWMDFLITFNPILLPAPEPTVYLDGQYIVYGMVDGALHWIADRVECFTRFFRTILVSLLALRS
jgi:hypothetical protein